MACEESNWHDVGLPRRPAGRRGGGVGGAGSRDRRHFEPARVAHPRGHHDPTRWGDLQPARALRLDRPGCNPTRIRFRLAPRMSAISRKADTLNETALCLQLTRYGHCGDSKGVPNQLSLSLLSLCALTRAGVTLCTSSASRGIINTLNKSASVAASTVFKVFGLGMCALCVAALPTSTMA